MGASLASRQGARVQGPSSAQPTKAAQSLHRRPYHGCMFIFVIALPPCLQWNLEFAEPGLEDAFKHWFNAMQTKTGGHARQSCACGGIAVPFHAGLHRVRPACVAGESLTSWPH